MNNILTLIVVFSPLVGFAINGLLGRKLPKAISGAIGTLAVLISLISTIMLWSAISSHGAIEVSIYQWLAVDALVLDFGFRVDHLSIWMMTIISGIGTLIHLYSIGYMHDDDGFSRFFAYLNLFVFSMFLLVMGSNFLVLFFGWEGVGLCSYLLIGFWYQNVSYGHAARKAFIMNRIGDLGLLIGMFLIFRTFGTLDFVVISELVQEGIVSSQVLFWIGLSLFVGAVGKSAQIPLFTWLPDAMSGPTPVSALIHAATMVTAGVYLVVRNANLYQSSELLLMIILNIGLATSILSAIIALYQNDIKKVLAYSTVSQLGLMFVAIGVGAYTTAMFHLTTHAFFKALLFLGAGSVIHAMSGEQDIMKMGGLKSRIKITHFTFLIGTLAIIGFPLFSGFFSKDEILEKVFEYSPIYWGLTLLSAALTGIYMLRMYFITFYGEFRGTQEQLSHLHESPLSMTLPLMILAVLSTLGGMLNLPHFLSHSMSQKLNQWISQVPSVAGISHKAVHTTSMVTVALLMMIAIVVVFVIIFVVYNKYQKLNFVEKNIPTHGLGKVGLNKFYIDEIYNNAFVKPVELLGELFYYLVEKKIILPAMTSTARLSNALGRVYARVQDGNVENYMLYMVLGIITFVMLIFVL